LIGEKYFWHKNYDAEALEFLKEFCFNIRNENIVTVSAFSHDTRTLKVYEKAGFKKTCVYRQRLIRGRDKYDEIHMDMLASEYWAAQRERDGANGL
jgi:RimJ/RimL family protein N-acetyltransferase